MKLLEDAYPRPELRARIIATLPQNLDPVPSATAFQRPHCPARWGSASRIQASLACLLLVGAAYEAGDGGMNPTDANIAPSHGGE